MNTKAILGFVVAALTVFMAVSMISALGADIVEVSMNDVILSEYSSDTSLVGYVGETVPIKVLINATENIEDLRVDVYIDGYDNEAFKKNIDIRVNPNTNVSLLSVGNLVLTLPSVDDMDNEDLDEVLTVHVKISNKDDPVEKTYAIMLQREAHSADFLYVNAPSGAVAGEVIAVDFAIENTGTHRLDNSLITVSIPQLGVSTTRLFGDLSPIDECTDNCDNQDAREMRAYLVIPSGAITGTYMLDIKLSDHDTTLTGSRTIFVTGTAANATTNNTGTIQVTPTDSTGVPTSIIVLTVILAIIFVVLLIVLIVLLTKKPSEKSEDFGETSYY